MRLHCTAFVNVAVIFLVLQQRIFASVLLKCPKFEHKKPSDSSSKKETDYLTIPESFMSNFETATFRLESNTLYHCDSDYEVIKINLIGSVSVSINLSTPQPPASDVDRVDGNLNGTVARNLYGPFPKSGNSSYVEGFMYSVENITAIIDTSKEREQQMCDRKLSRNAVHFTPSGFLFYSGEYYRPKEYCIQVLDEITQGIAIRKCNVGCSNEKTPCIPLCCHLHEYLDLSVPCCQATLGSKPMFHPVIYEDINRRLSLEETIEPNGILDYVYHSNKSKAVNDAVLRPHYVTFKYHNACQDGLDPLSLYFNENGDSDMGTRIQIRSNGKAAYIGADREWHFLENYCIAGLENADELEEFPIVLHYCLDEEVPVVMWPNYLLIGAFVFSSIFLLFTVVVYVLLWEKQNIHGWTIMSFVTSEFFLFTFLSISYSLPLFAYANDASRSAYCVGSGILAHFFFLSTFSWLTVINLDLWWTFKSLTPLSERSKGRKRFCVYMIFAWGIPITVVSVGLILQSSFAENYASVVIPDYGHRECFLAKHAKGVYLYYIIGILLLINCVLMALTFLTIYKFKQSTRMASASSSKSKERSFRLLLKLVIVMGVTWIFELILWLDDGSDNGRKVSWIALCVDLLNILQAVATFIIFVCKRKIVNQLEQKHPALRVITKPLMKVIGARSTSMMSSTSSKPTRSTTARSSVLQGSRNKSQRQRSTSIADSKL